MRESKIILPISLLSYSNSVQKKPKNAQEKIVKNQRPPTALTALGQGIVNLLWEELHSENPGEHTFRNTTPVPIMALDQPLVTLLWMQSRKKHGLDR